MNLERLKQLDIDAGTRDTTDVAAVVAILNKPSVSMQGVIRQKNLKRWGATGPLKTFTDGGSNGDAEIASICLTEAARMTDGRSTFDTGDAATMALIDKVIAKSIGLTAENKIALLAAGSLTVSPAVKAGLGKVRKHQLLAARGLV